jgi:hypothetical protein
MAMNKLATRIGFVPNKRKSLAMSHVHWCDVRNAMARKSC